MEPSSVISGSARLATYAFIVLCSATSFAADMHSIAVDAKVTGKILLINMMLVACDWIFRCLEPACIMLTLMLIGCLTIQERQIDDRIGFL